MYGRGAYREAIEYSHDDGAAENDVAAERDVTGDGQMVHLEQRGDRLESLLELRNLLGAKVEISKEFETVELDVARRDRAVAE